MPSTKLKKKDAGQDKLTFDRKAIMFNRYKTAGLENFQDHEVLEALLYYVYNSETEDVNKIAHEMINAFGTLQALFDADVDALVARLKCKETVATLISIIPSIAKRYVSLKLEKRPILKNADVAGMHALSLFVDEQIEVFYVLYLNKSYALQKAVQIARGTVDEVSIFMRNILRPALDLGTTDVILIHNHPSGSIIPSRDDCVLTTSIRDVLRMVNIAVVDHIVVGGDKFFSMAKCNYGSHVNCYGEFTEYDKVKPNEIEYPPGRPVSILKACADNRGISASDQIISSSAKAIFDAVDNELGKL